VLKNLQYDKNEGASFGGFGGQAVSWSRLHDRAVGETIGTKG
jgi:hypothetical protein